VKHAYYALWIPVLRETKLELIKTDPQCIDISDDKDDPFLINISIGEKSLNIAVRYTIQGESKLFLFDFKGMDSCGMLIYEGHSDDKESFFSEIMYSSLPKAIYHIIKEFFHIHKFHSSDEDSLIVPFFSDTEIKLNNLAPAYIHYIKEYQRKFSVYGRELAIQSKDMLALIEKKRNKKAFDFCKNLIENCEKAKGEYLYCSALIEHFREGDKLSTVLHDIKGNITDIDKILHRTQLLLNHTGIVSSFNLGVLGARLGYVSLLLGLVSVAITFWPSDSKSYRKMQILNQKMDLKDSIQNKKMNSMLLMQENLMKEINALTIQVDSLTLQMKSVENFPKR
jgi:hypothetical protein